MRAPPVLPVVSTVAAGWAALVVAARGVTVALPGGWIVRSHDAWPAAAVAGGAVVLALWRSGANGWRRDGERLWQGLSGAAPSLAAVAAVFVFLVGILYGTWTASGADAFGYVSQAEGWSRGDPALHVALADEAPWPDAKATFAPFGYRPDPTGRAIVPTYPPGLPLLMAPVVRLAGVHAAFVVVPVFGALLVWLTFVLGRRLDGPLSGVVAAALVATSPVVLFQVVQPMSAVPVAALWLAAWLLAAEATPGTALGAGAVASAAVLTRPNLVALVPVTALVLAVMARRAALFLAAAVPGVALAALLQATWYGSPFQSGYGATRDLFAASNVWPNAVRYAGWLLATQGLLVILAPLGWHAAWHWRQEGTSPAERARRASARLLVALGLAGSLVVVASYLPYAVFAEWHYLRFLMPALPVVLAGVAIALVSVIGRLPLAVRSVALVVLVALAAGWSIRVARTGRVFDLAAIEDRYRVTGEAVRGATTDTAVLLSLQQSGSLRFYAERDTLRWDLLDPAWLDRAVSWLEQRGHPVFVVSEQPEDEAFRRRFAAAASIGALDWPPRIEVRGSRRVLVHAVDDRARYLAGEPVATRRVFAR
jgi:4-amino-4-deoxy-L-arabinose transferase-like glycosyltransferase